MAKLKHLYVPALSFVLLATASAGPNTNLPFTENFESFPELTPLINGTNGWYADSAEAIVQTNYADTGSKAAAIPMDVSLTNRFTPLQITNVWLTMRVLPVLAKSQYPALINTNAASIAYITSNGWFGSWGGSRTNWNTHSNTLAGIAFKPVSTTNWVSIHLGQNYVTKKWCLFGNNKFLADNVPFINPNASGFKGFDIYTGIHTTYADNILISTNFPEDLAADGGDWLPDYAVQPLTSMRTDTFQGDKAVTNYVIWKTNGCLRLSFAHEQPQEWAEQEYAAFTPDVGATTGEFTSINISYNTTNMMARLAPYYGAIIVHGADARFGQKSHQSPQILNLEIHVDLHTTTNLQASRGSMDDRVRVEWSKVIGAGQYDLYRSLTNNPATAAHLVTIAGSIYDDLDVIPNTPYFYWVKSRNPFTTSAFSISNWGFCGMVTPTGVSASDGEFDNRVNITWNSSGAHATYQVWRHTSNNRAAAAMIGTTTDLIYNDFTAAPATLYYYWLRATNVLGVTEFSLPDTGFLGLAPPASISATDGTATSHVGIAWSSVAGVTGYELWRGPTDSIGDATRIDVTTSLNYNDSSVPPGIPFYYRIRTTNALTKSPLSASDSGFRGVPFPTGIAASDSTYTNKVLVTWNASEGAAMYEVFSGISDNPATSKKLGETAGLSFNDTACDVDTVYYYWVRARVGGILSQFSASDTGSRHSTAPPSNPPAWVDASDGAYTNLIRVRWPDTPETASYEVWRNVINDSASAELVCATADRSCDDTAVTAGMTYYYWVRGRNLSGLGAFSLPDSGYAAPDAPTGHADLELTDLIFLPNIIACGNHPGAISMRVKNHGPDALRPPDTRVTVDFFITTNTVFSPTEVRWIGDFNSDLTLAPDHGTRLIVPRTAAELLSMPLDLTGIFTVFARIRHSHPSGMADNNTANNTTSRLRPIEVPAEGGGIYQVLNDFDKDGCSDMPLYHQASGAWFILGANGQVLSWNMIWGGPGYLPVPGDYDGDRVSDLAVYYNGLWYITNIRGELIEFALPWGSMNATPVPGDYDGDGYADLAVYDQSMGVWYVTSLRRGVIAYGESWGGPGLAATPGDYSGFGATDLAVYGRGGYWYIKSLSSRAILTWQKNWGYFNMVSVPGDYDGDGYADLAVYGNGQWFIRTLNGELVLWADSWGGPGYLPVPGDFNGDGKADLAVYHAFTGTWFIKTTDQDLLMWGMIWGGPGYMPIGVSTY